MFRILKDLSARYVTLPEVPKSFLVVLVTYSGLSILFFAVRGVIGSKATDAMEPYNNSNMLISKNINTAPIPVLGNDSYTKIFRLQNDVIDLRRSHHYKVAIAFLKNYYAVITCLIFISCIGGMLLFVLINQGWKESSYTTKVLFLALASAAILFSLFSGVFSQQKNFEDNMLRYMNYTKAEFTLARELNELSKQDYKLRQVSKKEIDPAYMPAGKPTLKDSTNVVDTIAYFKRLDSMVSRTNDILNGYTDYILSTDASKMRNIGEVYQSLLDLKNMGRLDTLKRRN
jgi:hypothetical protein